MRYFTSDLHIGSSEIIETDNRPFKNIRVFNKYLIHNWNKQAKKKDLIYVIGDLIDCHDKTNENWRDSFKVLKKIKAEIILIIGNNEERIIKYFFKNEFDSFRNYCIQHGIKDVMRNLVVEIEGEKFFLTHKPKDHSKKMLTLFGHCHKTIGQYKSFGFNVDYDLNNFRLLSEKDIQCLLIKKRIYWDKDESLKLI